MSSISANIEPELNSLLTKLVTEIDNDRKEIDVRAKRIAKNEDLLRAVKGSLGALHPENRTKGYGAKSETVRNAIGRIQLPRFTQDDVEKEIARLNPEMEINRDRIRSALWTMARKHKEIKQVTKGNNRQPAEFEIIRTKRINEQDKEQTLKNSSQYPIPPRRTVQNGAIEQKEPK